MSLAPICYDCRTVGELRRALRDYQDETPLVPAIDVFAARGPLVTLHARTAEEVEA